MWISKCTWWYHVYYHFSGDDQLVNNRHYYRHLCIRTTVITPKAQGRGDKMTLMRVQEVSQSVSSGTFELVVRCSVYYTYILYHYSTYLGNRYNRKL